MNSYKLGSIDPVVKFDNGAGNHSSITPKPSQVRGADKFIYHVRLKLINSWSKRYFAPDAVRNLEHFLDNSGTPLKFSEEGFMGSSYCKKLYDREIQDAQLFCMTLPPGNHYQIVSKIAKRGDVGLDKEFLSLIEKKFPGNQNIAYSLGGFRYWGKAEVDISQLNRNDILYNMKFTFKLADRYNWNWDPSTPYITQATSGVDAEFDDMHFALLHLYGFAQDFDISGEYSKSVIWRKDECNGFNKHILKLYNHLPIKDPLWRKCP